MASRSRVGVVEARITFAPIISRGENKKNKQLNMPQLNGGGGDDLGANDEMISFKDEGEQEEKISENVSAERDLDDVKSSLVNESENNSSSSDSEVSCSFQQVAPLSVGLEGKFHHYFQIFCMIRVAEMRTKSPRVVWCELLHCRDPDFFTVVVIGTRGRHVCNANIAILFTIQNYQ